MSSPKTAEAAKAVYAEIISAAVQAEREACAAFVDEAGICSEPVATRKYSPEYSEAENTALAEIVRVAITGMREQCALIAREIRARSWNKGPSRK